MRAIELSDTLVHEYTEWEWSEAVTNEEDLTEERHRGVYAAEKVNKRFFQVLVKPNDELLSDTKPRNALYVDTWKYRARDRATKFLPVESCNLAATIALLARLANAKVAWGPNQFVVSVPGYGRMAFDFPYGEDVFFKGLPEVESGKTFTPVMTHDILEAVFLHDRKAQHD